MIHNHYLERGGEDESTQAEVDLLRENGHHVDLLEKDNKEIFRQRLFRTAINSIWSNETYLQVRTMLSRENYDVVHIQNFFPLVSPSVYYAAGSVGVPVIQALRNYRLLCLNGLFFREGKVCEDCVGLLFPIPGVYHSCYRQNRLASISVAAMLFSHRLLRTWQKQVTVYYTPTNFARQKILALGIAPEKVMVKPNFVKDPGELSSFEKSFMLLVSRLTPEKGVLTVLKAWQRYKLNIPLKIVGSGSLEREVREFCSDNPHVEYLGRANLDEVISLMKKCYMSIFCSELYETFGRTVIESFSCGRAVIATDIGTMDEIIRGGYNGVKFQAGDSHDLAQKVQWAWLNPDRVYEMGKNARKEYEDKYTPEINYDILMRIYQKAFGMVDAL